VVAVMMEESPRTADAATLSAEKNPAPPLKVGEKMPFAVAAPNAVQMSVTRLYYAAQTMGSHAALLRGRTRNCTRPANPHEPEAVP
jgi:predicted hotdog family 3-hydroxylacyl-ACP dehydratase